MTTSEFLHVSEKEILFGIRIPVPVTSLVKKDMKVY